MAGVTSKAGASGRATQILPNEDIILPSAALTFQLNVMQGARDMAAALVLFSAMVGLLAAVSTANAAPLWVALLSYPTVASLTLLMTAALWNIRTVQQRPISRIIQTQS